jgi:uncharacterized protein YyaL (SSP411 family)
MSDSTPATASPPPAHTIRWEPWNASAFERAAAERKAVLLSLTATWCRGCHVMDRTTYSDPAIVHAVEATFVPVRVDTDRRPDVNARYNLDGWPTTALLTPTGEMLTGSTYVTPQAMTAMLDTTGAAMRTRYDELMARAEEAARARRAAAPHARYEPDGEAPVWLASRMLEEEDPQYGGFGSGGKFPQVPLLKFAVALCARTGDRRLGPLLLRTLDALCQGGIFDHADGGVFRYAAGRDFTRAHTEKMLEDQIGLLPVLLGAARLFDRADYHDRAMDLIRYVRRSLHEEGTGFFASQAPDDEFYALPASIRASMEPPPVDRTRFTDLNAQAIEAWLVAAAVVGDGALVRQALGAVDTVLRTTYARDVGHRHWTDFDATSDLLADQVHAAAARLGLFAATGDRQHLAAAEDLARTTIHRFWDDETGGFFDRAPGSADEIGLLRDRIKPLALNSLAARVLARLGSLTGSTEWPVRARQALGAVTGTYRAQGLAAAPYALAALDLLAPEAPGPS